jgi:hypothetical protein
MFGISPDYTYMARTVDRTGELLKEIPAAKNQHEVAGGGAPTGRMQAAREADLSRDQTVTPIRVNNVPQPGSSRTKSNGDGPRVALNNSSGLAGPFYLPNKPQTCFMNRIHFCCCRGSYGDALQIRFAPLSRGAPVDVNLNAGLQSITHNDGSDVWWASENDRFHCTLGLRWA